MSDTTTDRERLIGYALAATPNEVTFRKAEQLADAYRDQVLTEAAELIRAHRGDLNDDAPWWDTRDRDTAVRLLLNARTTTAKAPELAEDEWVRCSRPHCPNGEWFAKAAERGWQHGHMDTWLCPKHTTTQED